MNESISIPVHLHASVFRAFAVYDALILKKHWRPPAIFAFILLFSAGVCLYKGSQLLTTVLSLVALGLPAVYFGTFFHSVSAQCTSAGLALAPLVYTVIFSQEEILVTSDQEEAHFSYQQLYQIYWAAGCIYLYVHPAKSFLLPGPDIPGGCVRLWEALQEKVPAEKMKIRKGRTIHRG